MFKTRQPKNINQSPTNEDSTNEVIDPRVIAEVQARQAPYHQMLSEKWRGATLESLKYDPHHGSLGVCAGGVSTVLSVTSHDSAAQIASMSEMEPVRVFVGPRNSAGVGVFFMSPSWCYSIPLLTMSEPVVCG